MSGTRKPAAWGGSLFRYATSIVGIIVMLTIVPVGAASAALPPYEGTMSFPPIQGASDPEEYSWEVNLAEGQELQPIDEQHAAVYYTEGHVLAFGITAELAHDAIGTAVPTTLSVSGSNVIALTVHHRAGNPATGGAPFAYPVTSGAGWEGGSSTEQVKGPPDESEADQVPREVERRDTLVAESCRVPKLKGSSLKASKRRLREADCKIGKVRKRKGASIRTGRVAKQNPKPGAQRPPGTAVDVTLIE